jgi:hypothetical protein
LLPLLHECVCTFFEFKFGIPGYLIVGEDGDMTQDFANLRKLEENICQHQRGQDKETNLKIFNRHLVVILHRGEERINIRHILYATISVD